MHQMSILNNPICKTIKINDFTRQTSASEQHEAADFNTYMVTLVDTKQNLRQHSR
jgi:hypothetical protein